MTGDIDELDALIGALRADGPGTFLYLPSPSAPAVAVLPRVTEDADQWERDALELHTIGQVPMPTIDEIDAAAGVVQPGQRGARPAIRTLVRG